MAVHKRVEEALRQNEERFRLFPIPFGFDTTSLRILEANEAAVIQIWLSREELLAIKVTDIWEGCAPQLNTNEPAVSSGAKMAKGQWLSATLIEYLQRRLEYSGSEEQVRVRVPTDQLAAIDKLIGGA